MPRLYLTPQELAMSTIGVVLAPYIAQLQASPGALDLALMHASERCDGYCRKRLGAPLSSTVAAPGMTAGQTVLPVTSTLGWDDREEQAVQLGVGLSTQETVAIVPGGITLSAYLPPYPGTITLTAPTQYAHNAGETVQGVYQEITQAGSSSSSDVYGETFTQEAQLAMAHMPAIGQGNNLTRLVFVKSYPIVAIISVEHAYPFNDTYYPLDAQATISNPKAGFFRLSLGSIALPQGMFRTTYLGGFQTVPSAVKQATAYYFADECLIFQNAAGALSHTLGRRNQTFVQNNGKMLWVQKAEQELDDANLRKRTYP
jgi:hypothetical protein